MLKSGKLILIAGCIFGALIIGIGIFLGIYLYQNKIPTYAVEDTLPDGGERTARVIILAGQSNASGCARDEYLMQTAGLEKYGEYQRGYENVHINYVAGLNASGGFVSTSVLQGELDGFFGPELGMAEKLNNLYPNEEFFIIKCAFGGTNLFEQWLSPSSDGKTGEYYKKFVGFVRSSIEYLESKNYKVEISGMCWMQGESDSFSVENATDYEEHLSNLILDVRDEFEDYARDGGIAFVDAYIADNPVYWVFCKEVNASKDAVAAKSPLNLLIDTVAEGLSTAEEPWDNPDLAHYDSQSTLKLGYLFIEALIPFLK